MIETCYRIEAVTCVVLIGWIGTHAQGRQMTSLFCQIGVIWNVIQKLGAYFKIKMWNWMGGNKKNHHLCEGGIEKNPLSGTPFVIIRQALWNGDPLNGFFYPSLTHTIDSYIMRYHDSIGIHIFFIIKQNDTVEKYRSGERERERERGTERESWRSSSCVKKLTSQA